MQSDIDLFLCYLSSLLSQNLSASYIFKKFAGISFFQKLLGLSPVNSIFLIKQTLKGYKKLFPKFDSRRPITLDILSSLFSILPRVCSSFYEATLFRAAFVIAFFAALRISEFVAPNKKSSSSLSLCDVLLFDNFVKIFIKKSKTDQAGLGAWIQLNSFNSPICPVKVTASYLALRPVCLGNFFIHQDLSPLTKFQFNFILQSSLSFLHLDHLKFSSHSFRIGAATEAARLGLDSLLIKKLGRWESDRFRLYIRPNLVVSI